MSRDVPPFSNSTEGHGWMANWCDRCLVDAPFRNGISPTGCPLIMQAMLGQTPDEWLDGPRDGQGRYSMEDQYHCIDFRAPGSGNPDPKPKPTPPGQTALVDLDVCAGRRTLTTAPEPVSVGVGAPACQVEHLYGIMGAQLQSGTQSPNAKPGPRVPNSTPEKAEAS